MSIRGADPGQSNIGSISRPGVRITCISLVSGLDLHLSACKVHVTWRWCEQHRGHRATFSTGSSFPRWCQEELPRNWSMTWPREPLAWLWRQKASSSPHAAQITPSFVVWWKTAGEKGPRVWWLEGDMSRPTFSGLHYQPFIFQNIKTHYLIYAYIGTQALKFFQRWDEAILSLRKHRS